jgi:hypothetical protein
LVRLEHLFSTFPAQNMKSKTQTLGTILTVSILTLLHSTGISEGQNPQLPPTPIPSTGSPNPNSPKALEKKGTGAIERIQDLQGKVAAAKKSLEIANRPQNEREKDLDNSISVITTVLAEVSDGGEVYKMLQQSIATSEAKLKEYKTKMADPQASVKQQEVYLNLVNKFKATTDGLIKSRMGVTMQREALTAALDDAKRNKVLFFDMVQAEELEQANAAIIEMVKSMMLVSDSLSGIGTDLSKIKMAPIP